MTDEFNNGKPVKKGGGFCLLLVMALILTPAVFGRTDFVLDTIKAKPGERATGFISVPAGADEGAEIPVSIFHGAKPGKVLLVTAGVYGAEYSPILALQNLRSQIDPTALTGTVILVHVANPPAFFKRTIYYGPDWKNLNRVFPGRADGTVTERIAHALTEKLIRRADYYIDVHSGDSNESLLPYVVYYESDRAGRETVATGRRMALASGIGIVKIGRGRATEFAQATYTTNAAFLLGKPSLAIESGELGKPREADIARSERALLNIMRELEMLPGEPAQFKNQIFVTREQTLRSAQTGLFYSLVTTNQKVRENDLLGYTTDFFGARLEEIRAPFAGVVLYYTATPPVSKGEPLVNIGAIENAKK